MHDKKGKGLNFSGFSGYYGTMSAHDGYGGFNYESDFLYMNQSTWTAPDGFGYEEGWCDTGYQNVAAAAKATSLAWIYEYGLMETDSKKTFTLQSLIAAASWSSAESWDIISYTEKNGSLTMKATDEITATFSKGETIKFKGKVAKGFTNIAAVAFELVNSGSAGNTCTYGSGVQGVQLCIDDVKVKWSKKADLKNDNGKLASPYMLHHQHTAAHATAQLTHNGHSDVGIGNGNHGASHHVDSGYHSQLLSLGHDTGLTSQFHLPTVEHFLA